MHLSHPLLRSNESLLRLTRSPWSLASRNDLWTPSLHLDCLLFLAGAQERIHARLEEVESQIDHIKRKAKKSKTDLTRMNRYMRELQVLNEYNFLPFDTFYGAVPLSDKNQRTWFHDLSLALATTTCYPIAKSKIKLSTLFSDADEPHPLDATRFPWLTKIRSMTISLKRHHQSTCATCRFWLQCPTPMISSELQTVPP